MNKADCGSTKGDILIIVRYRIALIHGKFP